MSSSDQIIDESTHKRLAASLFNRVWDLLQTPNRTGEQDDEMLHAAHASRCHWGEAGTAAQRAIGEWQISRVYSVLGRSEPAEHHALRHLELTRLHDLGPFHAGYAAEALARAAVVAGDRETAARRLDEARQEAAAVLNPEERELLELDIRSLTEALKT